MRICQAFAMQILTELFTRDTKLLAEVLIQHIFSAEQLVSEVRKLSVCYTERRGIRARDRGLEERQIHG